MNEKLDTHLKHWAHEHQTVDGTVASITTFLVCRQGDGDGAGSRQHATGPRIRHEPWGGGLDPSPLRGTSWPTSLSTLPRRPPPRPRRPGQDLQWTTPHPRTPRARPSRNSASSWAGRQGTSTLGWALGGCFFFLGRLTLIRGDCSPEQVATKCTLSGQ